MKITAPANFLWLLPQHSPAASERSSPRAPASSRTADFHTDPCEEIPLCIDCDGTLIAGDLLIQTALTYVTRQPLGVFKIFRWLLRGRAFLKQKLASVSSIDVGLLPYRQEVLELIRAARAEGRAVFLVTAADRQLARQVADHLGCFAGVIASDGEANLKGSTKAGKLVERFGERGFDYVGDDRSDLEVWRRSREAVAVGPSAGTRDRLIAMSPEARILPRARVGLTVWLKLLRIHQWTKNLLIFVPVVTAHQFTAPSVLLGSVLGFIAFGFAGSGSYILNDLADLENDRRHPSKKMRPIASGEIEPLQAITMAALLLGMAGLLCAFLPPACALVLAVYLGITFSYTLFFKKMMLVDVILLATLYTVRILFGHATTGIAHSTWLLAFSIFIFFSLALAKRYTELIGTTGGVGGQLSGRGYRKGDEIPVGGLGAASGMVGVLVLVLYANSPEVQKLYERPILLLLLCPLFLYWVGRIWMLAHRRELPHDPVVFALHDPNSYFVGLVAFALIAAASW